MELSFPELVDADCPTLVRVLVRTVEELAGLVEEIGVIEAAETRKKLLGYAAAEGSDAYRSKVGSLEAVEETATLAELRGRSRALDETKWLLQRLVDHAGG